VSRVPNQPFAGKPVALQSAANGVLGGGRMQYDLRRSMIFLDAMTLNKPEIFIGNCSQKIDAKTGRITDQQAVGFIQQQLVAFVKFIERLGPKS
jgi:chromate reductase